MDEITSRQKARKQIQGHIIFFLLGAVVAMLYLVAMPQVLFNRSVAAFDDLYIECANALRLQHEPSLAPGLSEAGSLVRRSVTVAKLSCVDLKLLSKTLTSRGVSKDALIARGLQLAKSHPELLSVENEVLPY